MKVILLGKGKLLANMIESALDSGVEIVGVMRYERTTLSSFKLLFHDLFKTSHDLTLIKKYKLNEIKCKSANSDEFRNFALKVNTDIIIVGTWREKLEKSTYNLPKIGTVNIHPSLLPRYRGPNPYMQVIIRGEKKTGVTLHLMDENFDTGAVLLQKEIDIFPSDTGKELRERTFAAARELLSEFLRKIESEIIIPIKQNESRATYLSFVDENEKMLDFENKTTEQLYAAIRALHPWLPCYITIGNFFLKVNPYKCQCINCSKNIPPGTIIAKDVKTRSLTIAAKDGKSIKTDDLKLYGFFIRPFTKIFIKLLKLKSQV